MLANLERINFWSAVNLVLMIVVGISQVDKSWTLFQTKDILQVFMVKSFFAERSIFKSLVGSS